MNLDRPRSWIAPVVLGAMILIAGFGVMLTFWLTAHTAVTPGWPHYRAATFGDGALVPVLAASLFATSRWLRGRTQMRTPVGVLIGAISIAAVGGVLLQVSWLTDNHPQTNWSLPRPHHFAISGWYHAAFLVAAVALITTLAVDVVAQLRRARDIVPRELRTALARGELVATTLGSGWSFCLLVAIDGGRGSSAVATVGSVLVLMVASLLAVAWAVGDMLSSAASPVICAVSASLGIAVLCEWWPREAGSRVVQPIVLIVALALADGAKQAFRRWLPRSSKAFALAIAAGATCVVPMGYQTNLGLAIVLSAVPLGLSAIIERVGMRRSDRNLVFERAAPWTLCLVIPITDYIARGQKAAFLTAGLTFLVASIVVSRLTFPFLKREWHEFNEVEIHGHPGQAAIRSKIAKHVVYRMACLGTSIFVAFAQIAFAVGPSLGFIEGTGVPDVPIGVWCAGGAIALAALTTLLLPHREATPEVVPAILLVLAVVMSGMVSVATLSGQGQDRTAILTAVQALLIFGWQAESVLGNAMMRGIGSRRSLICTCLASGTVIASLDFWAASAGQFTHDHTPASAPWCLLVMGVVILATVSWSYVCGKLLDPVKDRDVDLSWQVANYRLTSSLLQDAGIMGLLTTGLVWMVGMTFSHIPPRADERTSAIFTFLIGLFLFFTAMFKWTLENNVANADVFFNNAFPTRDPRPPGRLIPIPVRHVPGQYRSAWRSHRPGTTDARRFSFVLDAHIASQNSSATVMLVTTVAGAVGIANEIEADT